MNTWPEAIATYDIPLYLRTLYDEDDETTDWTRSPDIDEQREARKMEAWV